MYMCVYMGALCTWAHVCTYITMCMCVSNDSVYVYRRVGTEICSNFDHILDHFSCMKYTYLESVSSHFKHTRYASQGM